ncbi:MAG: ATP-binding cassette domain-containing protein [Desulfuromusa sp.]|nr:ATP-binding cassette domain-containing protein [Desulfuromusa sp.]
MSSVLSVNHLHKQFRSKNSVVNAVSDVSFDLQSMKTLALVGESGCGKSTIASAIMRLIEVESGEIRYNGVDVRAMGSNDLQMFRREVSIVFQNPYSSLNPKMRIKHIVGEPLSTCYGIKGSELKNRVTKHLEDVGLGVEHLNRYPHQFSGGQRQRIAIARSLALEPKVLILDEPTAALDVSVQAQVLNLLQDLKQRMGLAYLFISHNLATVEYIADYVMVMYLGRIVEQGPVGDIFQNPRHPYTQALLNSVPSIDPAKRNQLKVLEGDLPDPGNLPDGCAFYSRCGQASQQCKSQKPELEANKLDSAFACHNPNITEE